MIRSEDVLLHSEKKYIVHVHNLHDCLCKNEEHLKASSSMSDRWS